MKMTVYYIGCSGDLYWVKAKAKTLLGAKREAIKTCEVQTGGKIEIAELTEYGYEKIAVKHGFDKWITNK